MRKRLNMRTAKVLSSIFMGLFFTSCSVLFGPNAMQIKQKAFDDAIAVMLDESSYEYSKDKILRFKEGRFAIYHDKNYAPTSYGTVKVDKNIIYFDSGSRLLKQNIDINETTIRLYTNEKENILVKQNEKDFYKAENYFEAIEFGFIEDMQKLFRQGLDVNKADDLGKLPLNHAILFKRTNMAKFLVTHHADIMAENRHGYTALHSAIESKNSELAKFLLLHGAKSQLDICEDFLEVIQKDKSFEMAKLLLSEGLNPSCENSQLLFWAIGSEALAEQNKSMDAVDFLLAHHVKSDVFSLDEGDTPVMRAAAMGRDDILEKLIDYGSNIHAHDNKGRTALDFDSLYLETVNPKIAELLKKNGLTDGIKANSNREFNEAIKLLGKGTGHEAYVRFRQLRKKYKQNRFTKGLIRAIDEHKKPTKQMIKELIAVYAANYHNASEIFYLDMIRFYEKMLAFSHNKEDVDANGNYLEGSIWYVYEKIDRLYIALFDKTNNVDYLYKRWKNYKRFKHLKRLVRKDIKSDFGTRYVGESLNGKPFGKGSLHYADRSKYYGDVFHFIRHGKGKMTYVNGTIHDGRWQNDSKEGQAFFTDENNSMYLGTFKNNVLVGEKKLVRKEKTVIYPIDGM